jgi:hypothetical protein
MSEERPSQEGKPADEHGPEAGRWLDRPGSVGLIIWVLVAACASTVFADLFYHKHADYSFQHWMGFDAAFGFLAYASLVTLAKRLRLLLMRGEDYYD